MLGRIPQQQREGADERDYDDAGSEDYRTPAKGNDQWGDQEGEGAAKSVAHRDDGHGQAALPAEPAVYRGNRGVVVPRTEPNGHEPDEDQEEIGVAVNKGQQQEAQSGYNCAQEEHGARPPTVGEIANYWSLKSTDQPAQHVRQGYGGHAYAKFTPYGNHINGEASVETAVLQSVGDDADGYNPPAIEYAARGFNRGYWGGFSH